MTRFLIIQENGRNPANREFRECFSLQRAWTKLGHEADIWGLGHANFHQAPDFNRYDVILNIENYDDDGWLPNLLQVQAFKILWAIDEHCRGVSYYETLRRRDKVNAVLHATKEFVRGANDWWCPNCFDDVLIGPRNATNRADVGFCGNKLNRQSKLNLLRQRFSFVDDIMVLGQQMVNAVNSYRIHFNCNLGNDINFRSFETIGCGVPLATNFNAQYLELGFADSENCILYRDDRELVEKIRWWLDHPTALERLGRRGLELSRRHTYVARCRWLWERIQEDI